MLRSPAVLSTLLVLATVVSGDPLLFPRASCSCPSLDNAFYAVSTSTSSTVGTVLNCVYPALSRCQYAVTGGALLQDSDAGLCPVVATGSSCPSTDLGGFTLGPGSGVHGSILYCTYPTVAELSSVLYSCQYSATTGLLTTDLDDGFCPAVAGGCSASATPPAITTTAQATATARTGTGITPTFTSSSSRFSSSPSATSKHTKNVTAVAVGAAIGGIVLLAGILIAVVLIKRRQTPKNFNDATSPPTSVAPLQANMSPNMNMPPPNQWQTPSPAPPSVLPNPYTPSPPPNTYSPPPNQYPSPYPSPAPNMSYYGTPQPMNPYPSASPSTDASYYGQPPMHPQYVPEL